MLECIGNRLVFTFPEVHKDARVEVEFQRTLRIPDDDKTYPLPPGLGQFPLRNVDDFKSTLSAETIERGGVMIPMFQSEALWISFQGHWAGHTRYPFALKIGAGKRSAVTGNAWSQGLTEKDYVVVPVQPWLDGFMLDAGTIRQFVAAPLGAGYTVEEQLTHKAEFGGIQIEAFPMTAEEFNKRFPPSRIRRSLSRNISENSDDDSFGTLYKSSLSEDDGDDGDFAVTSSVGAPRPAAARGLRSASLGRPAAPKSMGMAAGGRMKQDIKPDPYGLEVWDTSHSSRTFVSLFNSMQWKQITGEAPPGVPQTARDYNRYGLPWYEYYSDGGSLSATGNTKKIKSAAQLDAETDGIKLLPDNESTGPKKILVIPPHAVKPGNW